MVETTDQILATLRTRAMIPTTDNTFTDAKLLDFLNRDLTGFIMPLVFRYHENYYIGEVSTSLVQNQSRYEVPNNAFVTKLRHIEIEKSDGSRRLLPRIELSDAHFYNSGTTSPTGYYMEGKFVRILPSNGNWDVNESLIMNIIKRPNKITAQNRTAVIASYTSTTITLEAAFGDGTIAATDNFDVISSTSGFETLQYNLNPDTLVTTTVTFPAGTFSTTDGLVKAGDFLSVTGESKIPQCPEEFLDLLIERAARRVFLSLGDATQVAGADRSILELTEALDIMMADREISKPAKLTNPYSILRGGRKPSRRAYS